VVLSSLTDASLQELANQWLGKPMDIRFAPWTRDPQGRFLGGNEMSLSPIEMVQFGELYRAGGKIRDQRVFSESWVRQSFTARTRSPFSGDMYGYGWFLRQTATSTFAYARGYGGQFIHVIPGAKMVVAMTSDWTRAARGGEYTEQLHDLVTRHLLARFPEAG
jgi:CubicO group peptidase (beta-lactamase class C family)